MTPSAFTLFPKMGATDTAIGSVGIGIAVPTLLDACYARFKDATSPTRRLGADATSLDLRLSIEREKFEMTRNVLKTTDARIVGSLYDMSPKQQTLVGSTLEMLADLFHQVELKSGATQVASNSSSTAPPSQRPAASDIEMQDVNQPTSALDRQLATGGDAQDARSAALRSWLDRDTDGAERFLERLSNLNKDLRGLLPRQMRDVIKSGYPAAILPDVVNLRLLRDLRHGTATNDPLDYLQICANLRSANLTLDTDSNIIDREIKKLTVRKDDVKLYNEVKIHHFDQRAVTVRVPERPWLWGRLGDMDVVVECRNIGGFSNLEMKATAQSRVEKLAILLSRNHGDRIHLLQLIGIYRQDEEGLNYGLVYGLGRPASQGSPSPVSLEKLMGDKKSKPLADLGTRFSLALALATAVMHIHACKWLHKGINTSSIVFLQDLAKPLDLRQPKLLGFEFSRPESDEGRSWDERFKKTLNPFLPSLYQDKAVHYQRKHDYFALGVCFICIGLWTPMRELANEFVESAKRIGQDITAQEFEIFLREKAKSELPHLCGMLYTDVVLQCMSGEMAAQGVEDVEAGSQAAFFHTVIRLLASCRA